MLIQRIRKRYYKTFGISVINSSLSHIFLHNTTDTAYRDRATILKFTSQNPQKSTMFTILPKGEEIGVQNIEQNSKLEIYVTFSSMHTFCHQGVKPWKGKKGGMAVLPNIIFLEGATPPSLSQ